MKFPVLARPALLAALVVGANAAAYEDENAVPLKLGLEAGKAVVERIAVKLVGRDVSVLATLRNGEARAAQIGWYASTPQFTVLGEGEEHLDKSFSDVGASFNGRAMKPAVYRRGYFMGRDITRELAQAGLAPLPDLQADARKLARLPTVLGLRFDQWQGYVAYSWSAAVAPHASAVVEVRYRALPQFSLTELDSPAFDQAVLQHCGNPDAIRRRLRQTAAEPLQVMVERYEIPLAFMLMRDVQLAVTQPQSNWQKAHPAVSLVCGLANPGWTANVSGEVGNANLGLSVLVVSSLNTP
ncbi:hypothetical protein [Duganella vulcania]|uniref:DUF4424 domain-containing protein n=1 Tax=Duganella vulcania TaxID=2692166 RepID=A0A845GUX1_9BURK|nr:hypothetical protein [Duganella vulcania]MYM97160.1 hypothetical protein [Duganella vulcania]